MNTKIVGISIAAVIGIIVLGSVLMPILDDATAVNEKFTNEGYYNMDLVEDNSSTVIRWEKASPSIFTIDGESFDMSAFTSLNRSYTIIGSDTLVCRYYPQTTRTLVQVYTNTNDYYAYSTQDTMTYVELSISNGTLTITSDKSDYSSGTVSIGTECFVINPTGEYAVMKKATDPAYVLGDSPIRFIGVTGSSSANTFGTYGTGSIDDGMDLSVLYLGSSYTSVTFSDPTPTMTPVDGFKSLYSLDKYDFTATVDGSDQGVTYSYFIVPSEVTAEKAQHLSDNQNQLLAVIPLLIIVAILLGVVALVVRSRME